MIDTANISFEQAVEVLRRCGYDVKPFGAGAELKTKKQIEVFKRLRGAVRTTLEDMARGPYSLDSLRKALAAADEVLGEE